MRKEFWIKWSLELVATLCFLRATNPPNFVQSGDKVIKEGRIFTQFLMHPLLKMTTLLTLFTNIVMTLIPMLLIEYPSESSTFYPPLSTFTLTLEREKMLNELGSLTEFTRLDITMYILFFIGYVVREWCYSSLGRFFTYEISIRSNHKLIQSGPYKYCRHPSYTALFLIIVTHVYLHFSRPCFIYMTMIHMYLLPSSPLLLNVFHESLVHHLLIYSPVHVALLSALFLNMRVKKEEEALKKEFKSQWNNYVKKTTRFIPKLF